MPQSFVCLHCHIVFSTRERQRWLHPEISPRLYGYMGGALDAEGAKLLAAGGVEDHVHLLVSLGKEMAVADVVRAVKSNSSRWLHETFRNLHDFAWQTGYGAFSVSHSRLPSVERYIASQVEHHRVRSFQEEFVTFLKRHHIPYDERYLWD